MCAGANAGSSPGNSSALLNAVNAVNAVNAPCNATKLHGVANAAVTIRSYQALPRTTLRYCVEVHIILAPKFEEQPR
jgi:hypothetical protein